MSDGLDVGKVVSALVWPQREDFETGHFYGWRIVMAVLLLSLGGIMAMHIALACGLVSVFGFTGFAQANDIKDLKLEQQQMRVQMAKGNNEVMAIVVGGQIFDLRVKQCAAIKARNYDAMASYSQQMQGQIEIYQRVSGQPYPIQSCP